MRARIPLSELCDVAVRRGVVWARLVVTGEKGGELVLPGLSPGDAEAAREEIKQRFSRTMLTEIADPEKAGAELDSFYAQPRYLSARDADLWLRARRRELEKWLAPLRRLQSRPLFAEAKDRLPESIRRLLDLDDARAELRERNEKFAEKEMRECASFFDNVEKTPLTAEQRRAAVVTEYRNLLVAAAGSGKTSALVGKIGYALLRNHCRPEEIAALAFNKKAAEELRERISARLKELGGESVHAGTFHSLGLRFLGEATGKKPRIAEWAANMGENTNRRTDELIRELAAANPEFLVAFSELCAHYRYAAKPRKFFKPDSDYFRHLENIGAMPPGERRIPTIKGDPVKSFQEAAIANFLFLNGVEYEYEEPYEHPVADERHGQYRPDFYYPRAKLYHEHFALDEKGNAPDFMGGKEYARQTEWKKSLHKEKGTLLLVTTSAEFERENFFAKFRGQLEKLGVLEGAKPLSRGEILGWLQKQETREIYKLMSAFLSRWKSGGLGGEELAAGISRLQECFRARARVFLRAMILLREFYDGKLKDANEADFDDMLAGAAKALRAGEVSHPYKLILADEFQDISRARAEMIKAMLESNPDCKLFAVGDDWQAIYRFAGSDIFIMTNFQEEFGAAAENFLTRTFRCNQGIADTAARFVSANPSQTAKEVRAGDSSREGVVHILRYPREEDAARAIESQIFILAKTTGAGVRRKIFILGRYNLGIYKFSLTGAQLKAMQNRFPGFDIEFLTMHKAKGLEADFVFVLGMNAGKFGFPSEKEDDPVMSLVTPEQESFEFAEERRLFYVALTRAKTKVFLLARRDKPSVFVGEIAGGEPPEILDELTDNRGNTSQAQQCPLCKTGVLMEREGPHSLFYGCFAWRKDGSGCGYREPMKCPRCGRGILKLRNGKIGKFYGCSGYPNCKYTRNSVKNGR